MLRGICSTWSMTDFLNAYIDIFHPSQFSFTELFHISRLNTTKQTRAKNKIVFKS